MDVTLTWSVIPGAGFFHTHEPAAIVQSVKTELLFLLEHANPPRVADNESGQR
jgi:hypothetical protein